MRIIIIEFFRMKMPFEDSFSEPFLPWVTFALFGTTMCGSLIMMRDSFLPCRNSIIRLDTTTGKQKFVDLNNDL